MNSSVAIDRVLCPNLVSKVSARLRALSLSLLIIIQRGVLTIADGAVRKKLQKDPSMKFTENQRHNLTR